MLHQKIKSVIKNEALIENKNNLSEELNKFSNQMINKITNNIEKFSYNVIIANIYEIYNYLNKKTSHFIEHEVLKTNYIKILTCMSPVIPHFAQECLSDLNYKEKISWPRIDKKYLIEDEIEIVIQINGKKRLTIKNKIDSSEKEIYDNFINTEYFNKNYKDKNIKKIIFVKNRLLNLIIA